MQENKKVTLPSGAELTIGISPFEVAKNLYQAILEEVRVLKLDPAAEIDVNLFKDLYCTGFSSKKIEACVTRCFEKVLYNGARVTAETWEPVEARQDYQEACWAVAQENIEPFTKSLYAKYQTILKGQQVSAQA
jgi:hypothetical protein